MSVEPTRTSQETVSAPMSLLDRVAGMFYEPAAVFRSLRERPDFILPVILILCAGIVTFIATMRGNLTATLTPEQAEAIAKIPRLQLALSGAIGSVVMVAFGWVIRSLVFMLLGKATGGMGGYGPVLSSQGYVMLPQFLGTLIGVILMLGLGRPVTLSLADFLSLAKLRAPLGAFLSQINPFVLGYLILAPIAIMETSGVNRRKALAIVMPCWALVVLVQAILAIVSHAMQG